MFVKDSLMNAKVFKESTKINTITIIKTLFVIAIYILLDGYGIISNGFRFVGFATGNLSPNDAGLVGNLTEQFLSGENINAAASNMVELQRFRLLYLVIALFPIVFVGLKYHISFKVKNKSELRDWIPCLRLIFGAFAFYYILTIKTLFTHECFTDYYSFGSWPYFLRIIGAFAVLTAFVLDWRSFWESLKRFPNSYPRVCKASFVLCVSICSCMLLEYQAGSKMDMISYMVFYNVLYWIILQVIVDVITNNVKVGAFVSLGLAYLIGLINDVVFQFRGNYVMFGDLTVVRTALEVAGNYTYHPSGWFWLAMVILIIAAVLTILIKFPKHKGVSVRGVITRVAVIIALVAGVIITFRNGTLYNNVNGVGWNYNENVKYTGYIAYFLSNMNAIKSVTLDNYESALAEEAFDSLDDQPVDAAYEYPNIIIIQNEAFADLSVVYDIDTNIDYMPFIHSLSENTRKGYLNMSVTGGPTANTEYEILMRSTLCYLPYGSVPYTQYVDADYPSIVQVLRNQQVPYYTVAYHPYYASGYRRTEVYNHFGFDEIVFEDDFREVFPESEIIRDYLSDSADYRRVEEMYEDFRSRSDAPWFCFNVTIQNHGGYTQNYSPAPDDYVYVTNFDATESFNGYLSLIKESDDAFRELIEYFEQCDEPTIIAMYGDHQPMFDDETLGVLNNHFVDGVENRTNYFYVPYVIWANFDIEEEDLLSSPGHEGVFNTLSTNYYASTVFDLAGIELADYDRYLIDLHERIPAITALGVWDSEGNYYSSPAASPFADELSALQMVQYNLLFDDDNRLTSRFVPD